MGVICRLIFASPLAEAEGKLDAAEARLIEGLEFNYHDKVDEALKALYGRRHGGQRGFAKYRAGLERILRGRRQAKVLATRIAEPRPLVPFALPRLGGGELRSEALAGRFTVINLWATHCHPCVMEMPDLQKFADGLAGAADVTVTTINIEGQTDALAAWMKQRGLVIDVLLGGQWYAEGEYKSLPTTLFVDPQGRVVFVKEGATDHLIEEFTWRLDAMRAAARGPGESVTARR